MVRITDILKRERDREDEERKKTNKSSAGAGDATPPKEQEIKIKPIIEKLIPQKEQEEKKNNEEKQLDASKKQEINISSAFANENKKASKEECIRIYADILTYAKVIFRDGIEYNLIDVKKIKELVEKIVVQLSLKNEHMLSLAFTEDSWRTDYLFSHSINTCIYSIQIGIGIGSNTNELIDLGISSFLHDIGMTKYINTTSQTRKLTNEEYKEVQNHTKIGFELLQKVGDLPNSACHAVLEHHERINGSGYPNGLKGESIDQYAKIIGLADVFTAIIHDRPYRKKKLAIDAVKEILNIKDAFEYNLIKLLLNRIGLYPIGSFIQLNTNEIAQVVKLNYDVPLRPVVNIFPQEGSQTLKEVKVLDLSAQPTIFIKSAKVL